MIQEFIDRFLAKKPELEAVLAEKHPSDYKELVTNVVKLIADEDDYGDFNLDHERVHQIDDGDYQGTLLFVIAAKGYQPSTYWYTKVSYGSCSGCDTLQAISNYSSEKPDAKQIKDYMTLALHIVEAMKKMGDDCA